MVELDLSLGCAVAGSLHIPNNCDVVLGGGLVTSLVLEVDTRLTENVVYSDQHKHGLLMSIIAKAGARVLLITIMRLCSWILFFGLIFICVTIVIAVKLLYSFTPKTLKVTSQYKKVNALFVFLSEKSQRITSSILKSPNAWKLLTTPPII